MLLYAVVGKVSPSAIPSPAHELIWAVL